MEWFYVLMRHGHRYFSLKCEIYSTSDRSAQCLLQAALKRWYMGSGDMQKPSLKRDLLVCFFLSLFQLCGQHRPVEIWWKQFVECMHFLAAQNWGIILLVTKNIVIESDPGFDESTIILHCFLLFSWFSLFVKVECNILQDQCITPGITLIHAATDSSTYRSLFITTSLLLCLQYIQPIHTLCDKLLC